MYRNYINNAEYYIHFGIDQGTQSCAVMSPRSFRGTHDRSWLSGRKRPLLAVQYGLQYSTVQNRTEQYRTVQYSTIQGVYNTNKGPCCLSIEDHQVSRGTCQLQWIIGNTIESSSFRAASPSSWSPICLPCAKPNMFDVLRVKRSYTGNT